MASSVTFTGITVNLLQLAVSLLLLFLWCYYGNGWLLSADHNEDDVFAVLPLPPRARKPHGLPPKGRSLPRPSLQGHNSTGDHSKAHSVSFKRVQQHDRVDIAASGVF